MSLNVTSAPQTLALLQALAQQAPSPQTSATGQASSASQVSATPASSTPAVDASVSLQHMFTASDGVAQALTAADAADAAGQGVMTLLHQMHAIAGQAADPATTEDGRAGLNKQFQAGAAQIASTLSGATVNGVNLVDGSTTSGLKLTLADGSTASLTPVDLSLGGSTLGISAQASVTTQAGAAAVQTSLASAIGGAGAGLSTLQAQADQVSAHTGFIYTLGQTQPAASDPDGDSARLMALQLSQQLSAQPTSIANQSPQSILSLFRG